MFIKRKIETKIDRSISIGLTMLDILYKYERAEVVKLKDMC